MKPVTSFLFGPEEPDEVQPRQLSRDPRCVRYDEGPFGTPETDKDIADYWRQYP